IFQRIDFHWISGLVRNVKARILAGMRAFFTGWRAVTFVGAAVRPRIRAGTGAPTVRVAIRGRTAAPTVMPGSVGQLVDVERFRLDHVNGGANVTGVVRNTGA